MQSSCLEYKDRRRVEGTRGRAVAKSKKREEELIKQGCRAVAKSKKKREEKFREQGCRAVA